MIPEKQGKIGLVLIHSLDVNCVLSKLSFEFRFLDSAQIVSNQNTELITDWNSGTHNQDIQKFFF
jgi:hypothetical protein